MNSSFSFLHDYWMMFNVLNNHFAFLARSLTRSLKMRSPVIRSLTWRPKRITSSRIQIRWITHDTPSWITLTTFSTTALEWFAGSKFRITHPYFCVLLVWLRCVDPVNREQETSVACTQSIWDNDICRFIIIIFTFTLGTLLENTHINAQILRFWSFVIPNTHATPCLEKAINIFDYCAFQ